jgi:acyl carrier protein
MADDVAAAFRTAMRLGPDFSLRDEMGFDDVPGWDSIGHMNLVNELETRLGVSLDLQEIVALDSVKAVRALVAQKSAASSGRGPA